MFYMDKTQAVTQVKHLLEAQGFEGKDESLGEKPRVRILKGGVPVGIVDLSAHISEMPDQEALETIKKITLRAAGAAAQDPAMRGA
jgi:hypothetical protein